MIDEHDVREMLRRRASAVPTTELDAPKAARRGRRRLLANGALAVLATTGIALATFAGVSAIRSAPVPADPPDEPTADLGIFEPVAGRIVYYEDSSLWGVDPNAPSPASTLVRLNLGGTADADRFASFTLPLGWSSDGTKLLFLREDPSDDTFPYDRHLYVLHADGTETLVTTEPVGGAAISPDGSRVVFALDGGGLYTVDPEGGQPVRITDVGESPSFSPDGTQIAYLSESGQAGIEHVWVANADGTDTHEILIDEALDMGMGKLTWSPAGDLIAMENQLEGHVAIYTFAPDGSDFTKVITGGFNHSWSPDGTQIAYGLPGRDGVSVADADGSNIRTLDVGHPGPWHPGVAAVQEPAPSPVEEPAPTPSIWSPVREGADASVHRGRTWLDPLDAPEEWIDVTRVSFSVLKYTNGDVQPGWSIELAAKPPPAADREPGLLIAYGLVLDTNADGVADHEIGIDNDAPERGDFHAWVTDLATGETDEQVGPPYGFPFDFSHPDERGSGAHMLFFFLPGSAPPDLDPQTVRWYAWSATTSDREVFDRDYAPDAGWMTAVGAGDPGPSPSEGEIANGWPGTGRNRAGLYSWDGSRCASASCNIGFMHNASGSGDVRLSLNFVPDGAIADDATAVTVAGLDGFYRRIDAGWEEWSVDIDGTTVFINLRSQPGTSQADLADAHAIISSMRTEPSDNYLGFRLVFALTNDEWDSG